MNLHPNQPDFIQTDFHGVGFTKNQRRDMSIYLISYHFPGTVNTSANIVVVRSKKLAEQIAGVLAGEEYIVSIKAHELLEGEPS